MIKTELINIKEDITKSYQIYKPSKINKDKYEIIFNSDISIFIQFILYVKFSDLIIISQSNSTNIIKFKTFPYNGILYSCIITPKTPLKINFIPFDLCTKIIIQKKIFHPLKSLKLNIIVWDKIFVINLARRLDRRIQIENFFAKSNISKSQYEIIEAYDGLDINIIKQYNKKKLDPDFQIITPGHFACLLSHLKVIKLAKKYGYNQIMILEDDVFFDPDLVSKLHSIYVPQFDLLYLGGIMSKKKYFDKNWAYSNKTNIMGAYAYILSSKIYDVILSGLENLNEYIDFFYLKKIQPYYKIICINDIIKTDLLSSDTSNKSKIMIKRLDYIK
jgi:GR25 family glycosyltransferase involved in LPS biosynthesis